MRYLFVVCVTAVLLSRSSFGLCVICCCGRLRHLRRHFATSLCTSYISLEIQRSKSNKYYHSIPRIKLPYILSSFLFLDFIISIINFTITPFVHIPSPLLYTIYISISCTVSSYHYITKLLPHRSGTHTSLSFQFRPPISLRSNVTRFSSFSQQPLAFSPPYCCYDVNTKVPIQKT